MSEKITKKIFNFNSIHILLICSFMSLSSCGFLLENGPFSSLFSKSKKEEMESKPLTKLQKPRLPALTRPSNGDPFILQVLSEQFDGSELVLAVGFASFEDADYEQVVIRLITQNSGEIIEARNFVVADLFRTYGMYGDSSAVLEKTYQYKFGLSIPASEGAEYQLELLWGAEAQPYLDSSRIKGSNSGQNNQASSNQDMKNPLGMGRKAPLSEAKNLVLQGLTLSKKRYCHQNQECQIEYHISAQVYNSSDIVVNKAVLAVGFLDKESSEYQYGLRIPEDEELVELPNFSLNPKQSQAIKLVLDQRIPESLDQRYRPMLRLVQK